MTKATRKRLAPEQRRKQLLETAKDMIVADGLQSFAMETLAKMAGVTPPLVYNHFSNRPELLRELLIEEYGSYIRQVRDEIQGADTFEGIVRIMIRSNFEHQAPGNILPILQSQPEIAAAIKQELVENSQATANYFMKLTVKSLQMTMEQAELAANMSSGAAIAAAQHASRSDIDQETAIELALGYVLKGMSAIAQHTDTKKPQHL